MEERSKGIKREEGIMMDQRNIMSRVKKELDMEEAEEEEAKEMGITRRERDRIREAINRGEGIKKKEMDTRNMIKSARVSIAKY